MTPEEIIIHNEKVNFKLCIEMLNQIVKIKFITPIGQELHADLVKCIDEVIKPIVKDKANKLIENGK